MPCSWLLFEPLLTGQTSYLVQDVNIQKETSANTTITVKKNPSCFESSAVKDCMRFELCVNRRHFVALFSMQHNAQQVEQYYDDSLASAGGVD